MQQIQGVAEQAAEQVVEAEEKLNSIEDSSWSDELYVVINLNS